MICRWRSVCILALVGIFQGATSFAAELPSEITQYLLRRNRADLIEKFSRIPVVAPASFLDDLSGSKASILGGGYFGVVFRDSGKSAYKLSHAAVASQGLISLAPARSVISTEPQHTAARQVSWAKLVDLPQLVHVDALYEKYGRVPVGGVPVIEELYGEVLMASLEDASDPSLADAVTSDGLGLKRRFIEGVPFDLILASQREGTELFRKYEMPDLWRQLVRLQRKAEALLFDTGVTVDMLTPGNFLVQGEGAKAKLVHFDHGLVTPTPETKALYAKWGIIIPKNSFGLGHATQWPLQPEHIVYSGVWGLSVEQAVAYAMAAKRVASIEEAMRVVAGVEVIPITMASYLESRVVIETCQMLMTKPTK